VTDKEFHDWFAYHLSCFTGIAAWLDKATKGTSAPSRKDILARWYGVLRGVTLADAKAATLQIHSGEVEEPKGFDRHPAAVRRLCKDNTNEYHGPKRDADGNETFTCALCLDIGYVMVWGERTVQHVEKHGWEHAPIVTAAAVCICDAGNKRAANVKQRYKANGFCRLVDGLCLQDDRDALDIWLETRKPDGYDPDLETARAF
jgi:hypothetical protein